jgi:hypothetical protein
VVFIHWESKVQQFQLTIISIQEVPPSGTILARSSHILPQPVERITLLRIPLRIIAICLPDIALQRRDPVDFVCLLQRARDHGGLQHLEQELLTVSHGNDLFGFDAKVV